MDMYSRAKVSQRPVRIKRCIGNGVMMLTPLIADERHCVNSISLNFVEEKKN